MASWPLVRNRPEPLEQESGHTIDVADLQKKKKEYSAFVIPSGPLPLSIIVLPIATVVTVSQNALSTFSKPIGVHTHVSVLESLLFMVTSRLMNPSSHPRMNPISRLWVRSTSYIDR